VLILDGGQRRNRFATIARVSRAGWSTARAIVPKASRGSAYPTVTWKDRCGRGGAHSRRLRRRPGGDESVEAPFSRPASSTSFPPFWPRGALGSAFLCPYCDGYEFGLGQPGVLATSPVARFAILISDGPDPANDVLLNGQPEPDGACWPTRVRGITIGARASHHVGGDERSVEVHLRDGASPSATSVPAPTHPSQGTVCREWLRAGDGAARLLLQDARDEGDDSQRRFRLRRARNASRDRVRGR